jgi:hypothetical protein
MQGVVGRVGFGRACVHCTARPAVWRSAFDLSGIASVGGDRDRSLSTVLPAQYRASRYTLTVANGGDTTRDLCLDCREWRSDRTHET